MRRMCNYTSNGDDHVFASFASSLSLFNMMQSIDVPNPFKRVTSKTIDSYRCRRVNSCWCGPNGDKSGDEVSISVPLSKTADDDLLRWWSRLSYPAYIPSSMLEGSPPSVCHSFTDDILLVPSPWPSPICVQALPWLRSKAANTSNWRETQEQDIFPKPYQQLQNKKSSRRPTDLGATSAAASIPKIPVPTTCKQRWRWNPHGSSPALIY